MIIQEHFEINGKQFICTYSNANRYVVGGVPYAEYIEATDPAEFGRVYTEGNIIEDDDITNDEIVSILLGGETE